MLLSVVEGDRDGGGAVEEAVVAVFGKGGCRIVGLGVEEVFCSCCKEGEGAVGKEGEQKEEKRVWVGMHFGLLSVLSICASTVA